MAATSDPTGPLDKDPLGTSNPGAVPSFAPPGPAGSLAQSEIEALLQSAGRAAAGPAGSGDAGRGEPEVALKRPAAAPRPTQSVASEGGPSTEDVEFLLRQAEEALASVNSPVNPSTPTPVSPFKFQDFAGAPASTTAATLDLIRDVELNLKIELGRTHMYLEDVLKLRKGSVVPLDKLAGDPVDIYVNGRLIARGEVLVLNDNFAVRVAELIAADPGAPSGA